jgi:hypothetical protein
MELGAVLTLAFCTHYNKYVCFRRCLNTHGDKANTVSIDVNRCLLLSHAFSPLTIRKSKRNLILRNFEPILFSFSKRKKRLVLKQVERIK